MNINEIKKNERAWDFALGLIKIDGLEPSEEFLELIKKEIYGELTTSDIVNILDKKYKTIGKISDE